jgi:hypothetical protein
VGLGYVEAGKVEFKAKAKANSKPNSKPKPNSKAHRLKPVLLEGINHEHYAFDGCFKIRD